MNCADPTEFALTWPRFCERGGLTDIHADGWGLAYYQDDSLRQFHDVEAASRSMLAQFLGTQPILTRNMLAHIRYATAGVAGTLANVHPFSREMWGIQWCFCHNGQVPLFEDHPQYVLGRKDSGKGVVLNGNGATQQPPPEENRIYHPIGTTDSEAAFCAILNALRNKFTDTMPSLPILYEELETLAAEIVEYDKDATILNFLLTCGPHLLWAYSWPGQRPGSKVWNGLYYTIRDTDEDDGTALCSVPEPAAGADSAMADDVVDEDDMMGNYAVNMQRRAANNSDDCMPNGSKASSGQVAVVATKPLTNNDEEWIELDRGELLVLDEGLPRVSVVDLFRAELQGHGLATTTVTGLPSPPRLEEDMRRYQFDPNFFVGGGI